MAKSSLSGVISRLLSPVIVNEPLRTEVALRLIAFGGLAGQGDSSRFNDDFETINQIGRILVNVSGDIPSAFAAEGHRQARTVLEDAKQQIALEWEKLKIIYSDVSVLAWKMEVDNAIQGIELEIDKWGREV